MDARRARIGMEPYVRQAQTKTAGQAMADMLGGLAVPTGFIPGIGDVAGAVSDAAMYAAYPKERTMLNAGMSLAGLLPFVPGAAGVRAAKKSADALDMSQAAEDAFTIYHGSPHVFGPSKMVRDVKTGKEYVSDPQMVDVVMANNPNRYEVLADHPLGIFDSNRIGTGEGAQAYGVGIYGAEEPNVARGYRDTLTGRMGMDATPTIGGKPITDIYSQIEQRAARLPVRDAQREHDKLEIVEQVMIDNDILGVLQRRDNYSPDAYAWFEKNVLGKFDRPGALYEVRVNTPKTSFLNWDAPISEQSPQVRTALESLGITDPSMTGQRAYYAAAPTATNQADASNALLRTGIQGVQYLDNFSRAERLGTRNFVLFDPKIADITKKYGIIPGALGVSALRGINQQEEK
jgi:hypothetical protein